MSQWSPIAASLNVAIGGATGAVLRYQLGQALNGRAGPDTLGSFPWATLAANAIGSLLMGVLVGWLARNGPGQEHLRLLLGVGLLGGFTTFSAFSLELVQLMERGHIMLAAGYATISVMVGIVGLLIGLSVIRLAT